MHKRQFMNVGNVKKSISGWKLIFKSLRHHRAIRMGTKSLINVANKQSNFDLQDQEKITLFNSTCKLLITYTDERQTTEAWNLMCDYCKKCGISFFEMKDKRGQGIEYRLAKNWPIQIKADHKLNNLLNKLRTQQMT